MAWTLLSMLVSECSLRQEEDPQSQVVGIPVEGTGENEVVIGGEAAQTGLVLTLVDQTAGLVDDD